jgi:hypothetical protein
MRDSDNATQRRLFGIVVVAIIALSQGLVATGRRNSTSAPKLGHTLSRLLQVRDPAPDERVEARVWAVLILRG